MSTHTVTRDRLHLDLQPGDRIVAIDGHQLPAPREVDNPYHWVGNLRAVSLINTLGSGTDWNIYPANVDAVTVERGDTEPELEPKPEPTPVVEVDPSQPLTTSDYQVGDPVLVFAWGQYRRGTVTKIGRTRLTIEHRRNASGDRHERAFTLGEIVRGWAPHPYTTSYWRPRMADGTTGRDHIGVPPTVPTRPRP